MTELSNPLHRERWRAQARRIAEELKAIPDWGEKTELKVGIALDDAMVTVKLPVALLQRVNVEVLGDSLFEAALEMLKADKDHRAAGESAGHKPGMERGHAAAQAPAVTGKAPSAQEVARPASAAVSEQCWRKIAPAFTEQCPNQASGGIRLKFYPALTIQKRYGKRDMLALIMDLPICADCFSQMSALEVINNQPPQMWGAFSKYAQQRNNGILPIKENSEIEHLPFDDPEYVALRRQMAKAKSQPAPAGPQPEGVGDG